MIYSTQTQLHSDLEEKVWLVVREGMRPKQERGNPTIVHDISEIDIDKIFPAQVEVGSGPAIEAGVPPLHYWHHTYFLSDPNTKQFIFAGPNDQLFQEIAREPETFFRKAAKIYRTSLCRPTTPFYNLLKKLHDKNLIVGNVITNNVDGFVSRVGLQEEFVRRYETNRKMPDIEYDSRAISYINIGVHADRRLIHQGAREKGLNMFYVDLQGFEQDDNSIKPYPLEAPQTGDVIIQMTTQKFAKQMSDHYGFKNIIQEKVD